MPDQWKGSVRSSGTLHQSPSGTNASTRNGLPEPRLIFSGAATITLPVADRGLEVAAEVARMAAERDLSAPQLAPLRVKDQPRVTAHIYGPRTMDHMRDALPVLEMTLADADQPLFDALVPPGIPVADFHDSNNWMKSRVVVGTEWLGRKGPSPPLAVVGLAM